jgi:hypothetical protein
MMREDRAREMKTENVEAAYASPNERMQIIEIDLYQNRMT